MKNQHALFFVFALSILLFTQSCVFDTDLIYENQLKEVTVPQVAPLELDLQEDTVFLYYDRTVQYKFVSSDQPIVFTRISIDEVGVDSVEGDSGKFELKMNLGLGQHTLKIEVFMSSGSGSMWEQVGGEVLSLSKTWVVSVLSNINRPLTYKYVDGFLNLVGAEYRGDNLKEYILSKEGSYYSLIPIARGLKPVLPDSCFLGEGGYYFMRAQTTDGRLLEMGRLRLPADPIQPKQELGLGNKLVMRWNKPKYYSAIRRFLTYQNNEIQAELTNMEDTVYPLKFVFGQSGTFRLNATSKYKNINVSVGSYVYDYTANYKTGISYNSYNYNQITPTQVSATDFVYLSSYVTFGRHSFETNTLTKSYYYPYGRSDVSNVTVSSTGKSLCALINGEYALVNLELMTTTEHRSLASWLGGTNSPCLVSDVGTVLVNKAGGGCSVVDMMTGNALCSFNGDSVKGLKLSSGGAYMLVQSDRIRLFHLVNGAAESVSTWSYSTVNNPYCDFDPTNSSQYFVWDHTTLSVYKNIDGSLVRSYPLAGSIFQSIDRNTNEMLVYSGSHMKVYDFENGSLLYDIPYSDTSNDNLFNCILVNGKIVSKAGLYYSFR